MRLVVTQELTGLWVQLEGETADEWHDLARLAASGERTGGRGITELVRLRELAARAGISVQVVWR